MKIQLQVGQDHVESLAKLRNPLLAIEELIWNGLDADASEISVQIQLNKIGGLDSIIVKDNGTGIPYDMAESAFGSLGNSPKLGLQTTRLGRVPHGKGGKGRFRAFGIGGDVVWQSRYQRNGRYHEFSIKGHKTSLRQFDIGDEKESSKDDTGVTVTIKDFDQNHPSLCNGREAAQELARRLALYLKKYPDINISYNKYVVDPQELESYSQTMTLSLKTKEGDEVPAEVTVIEWKTSADRALYLCDETGFTYEERPPGIQAPGFNFTAYLKSRLVKDLADENAFAFEGLHPVVDGLVESTKHVLRKYFREREATRAQDLVKKWKEDRVYPYERPPSNPISVAEQQVFDVCALKVNEYLPSFEKSDSKNKQLTFRLIREALESNPSSLQAILRQVLDLPEEQQNELALLLERTKLSSIITAAKTVIDRLTFLNSLDHLLFGDLKKTLLERRQLHRILVNELWILGEQYSLGVDDESLKSLLTKHVEILDRADLGPDNEVTDLNGKDRVVDLMLYRRYPQGQEGKFEHLVVELKRPACKLGQKEISQIENYAFTVSEDERFDKHHTRWTFILIGNDFLPFAEQRAKVQNREHGHIHASEDGMTNIFIKKWSSVIDQAKWRYNFFREKLELQVTSADGLNLLRNKYSQYLPGQPEE
jgi:Histidine kinase-, DNA gyrase B-, and HSP90-like ATPase